MTLQRTLQLLPVLLITVVLTLPASTDGDRSGTTVLENRGTRAVWFVVHEQERRLSVYPWGLEGYRRITAGRSARIETRSGEWTVGMQNASGHVEFTVAQDTVEVRLNSPGEDRIKASVHRDNQQLAFHEFEKQKTSTAVVAKSHSTNHTPYEDRNRTLSTRDQSVTKLHPSRANTRSSLSHTDRTSFRKRTQATLYIDGRSRSPWYRHRYRSWHTFRRGFRYCSPFSMYEYRHHDGFHRPHGSRYRFGLRFHFGGHHRTRFHHRFRFPHHGIRFHLR